MQRAAGLYGSLIVLDGDDQFKKEAKYAGELGDWYHEPVYAQAARLERKDDHFQWIGEPQTLLINGKGQFGCTLSDVVGEFKCDPNERERVEAACNKGCRDRGWRRRRRRRCARTRRRRAGA